MRFKRGVIILPNGDEHIAVAADEAGKSFNGMIKMNETAAFIAERLRDDTTAREIAARLCEIYDVSENEAVENVEEIISRFSAAGLIENNNE